MKAIVLVDEHWGIGNDGDQIIYIPGDLKYFRKTTMGHPVILGRKTLATFPGGRPLKGRRNLILSRNPNFAPEGAEVFSSVEALLLAAPLNYCETVYATKIHGEFSADCHFPNLDKLSEWRIEEEGLIQEEDGIQFHRITYKKA